MGLNYVVIYHAHVKDDIRKLDENVKERIKLNIGLKLTNHPEIYSLPLRSTLKGYRKLRVGEYRVILKISAQTVYVLAIMHRSVVYNQIYKRIS